MQHIRSLLFVLFWMPSLLFSQFYISGNITVGAKPLKRVVLYQIIGGKQVYIKNQRLEKDGVFKFELDKDTSIGTYRVVYDYANNGFVDVLFNKENIHFTVNAAMPDSSLIFVESKENIVFQNYLVEMFAGQHLLDSIQMKYFDNPSPPIAQSYREFYYGLRDLQLSYEQETSHMLARDFIHASQRYNSPVALASTQDYLTSIKNNFFKYIDFNNEQLKNSSFFVDRTFDYVFNLSYSKDPIIQENLYKEAIENLFQLPKSPALQRDLIEVLVAEFMDLKSFDMVNYLIENHYKNLPESLQDPTYISTTIAKITLLPGALAPNFNLDARTDLHSLNSHANYVLVFWSTSCGHCKAELPKLQQALATKTSLQIIAVGLEKEKTVWTNFIKKFPKWKHVLALDKWENPIATSYAIEATPTYVVLDKDKKIIALPDDLNALKNFISMME